ncbi:L,D-transpeptidase [Rhabdochromatium marinum]|uniref:L,D-transpeptidase n=1 Tax=Rhabdochromatium marinum TaxID=48729 RepID=UPI001907E4F8|nr:L,D-transpeptidase [Rhabdochromatium marinum]MBK1647568.1 hypothetical protein [Rhabdochromatium marinum]
MISRVLHRDLLSPTVLVTTLFALSSPAPAATHPVVHIADYPQEAAAWRAWDQLREQSPQAISGLKPQVVKRDWVYTLIGVADQGKAEHSCQQLRQVGQQCFISQANVADDPTATPTLETSTPSPPPPTSTPAAIPATQDRTALQQPPTASLLASPPPPSRTNPREPSSDQSPGLQLALYHQRAMAEQGWQTLSSRFPDLLANATPVYSQFNGYIALRAVVANTSLRDTICASLRQRGAECLPVTLAPHERPATPSAPSANANTATPDQPAANSATSNANKPPPQNPPPAAPAAPTTQTPSASSATTAPVPLPPPPQFGHGGLNKQYSASPLGPNSILISTADRKLLYQAQDGRIYVWPVAVGRHRSFHIFGDTEITQKRPHPTWTPPPEMRQRNPRLPRSMGPGPHNPLGAYALNLGFPYIRIHGTNRPQSVGRATSSGCYRMHADAIKFLFNSVSVGTPVRVTNQPLTSLIQLTAAK